MHTNGVSYFWLNFDFLAYMILNLCFTERNIEIQCVKCQEMGLHSIAFVLHKGKQFTYAYDIEFFMDYSESEVMKCCFSLKNVLFG